MKRFFIVISIVLILISCDNPAMENENDNDNGGKGSEAEYYPYEVTNLKYTKDVDTEESPLGRWVRIIVTWENPKDENFSNVNITGPGSTTTKNTYLIHRREPISPITIYCVDKQGKKSQGVKCDFGYVVEDLPD